MNIPSFYEAIGADYNLIISRFKTNALIEKYLQLVKQDENCNCLKSAVKNQDYEEAFRYAHTIKGIALSLELAPLVTASADLADYLKNCSHTTDDSKIIDEKCEKIMREYETIRNLIC